MAKAVSGFMGFARFMFHVSMAKAVFCSRVQQYVQRSRGVAVSRAKAVS